MGVGFQRDLRSYETFLSALALARDGRLLTPVCNLHNQPKPYHGLLLELPDPATRLTLCFPVSERVYWCRCRGYT